MAKKDDEAPEKAPAKEKGPLTHDAVQRMIDAALVRYDMAHGHCGADEGAVKLKALED